MKGNILYKSLLLICVVAFLAAGCKKNTEQITISTSDTGQQNQNATDEVMVNDEVEQAIDEAVSTLSISSTTSARVQDILLTLVTGAVVDTTQIANGIISVDYYAAEKDVTKTRTGSVQIKLPVVLGKVVSWKLAGTTATITFTNYEIKFAKTTKSLWFSGSLSLTNFSGGLQKNLIPGDSVVEKLRGQIAWTDNDNNAIISTWAWNLNSTRVIGMTSNNDITLTTRADTNVGGYNNVIVWGKNRFNQNFYTSLIAPVFRDISGSDFYYCLNGTKLINGITEPLTVTLGVDANGNPVANPYGYKLNWANANGAQTLVLKYY